MQPSSIVRQLILTTNCFMVAILTSSTGTVSHGASPETSLKSSASSKPNFVFILADDLGWADVGFHGGNAPTPQLDRLAAEGLELTRHYVAPMCTPTRTGLLTGRCWSRFDATAPKNDRVLPWDTVTLASALRSIGYATCLTGKWHLGSAPEHAPNHFGFDYSFGSLAGGVSPWVHRYKQGPFSHTWHRNGRLIEQAGHVTDLIVEEALSWLDQLDDRPFLLYVPFTAVHLPVKEPSEWLEKVPPGIQGEVPRHYAASIMHLDDAVGRILEKLDRLSLRHNTLVVFTSDNGGSTAENNDQSYPDDNCPTGKLPGNNLPWRGKKAELYEGGIRVPTIVAWPARILSGKSDTAVQIIDWMPTLCALAAYRADDPLMWDGIDLSAHLIEQQPLPPRSLYTVGPDWRGRCLHQGQWKLIVHEQPAVGIELYHLGEDPSEASNLARRFPQRVAEMQQLMDQAAVGDRSALPEPP